MIPKNPDKHISKFPSAVAPDFIPLFGGRPKREKVIGRDDTFDLKILLNTSASVEEFVAKL